MFNLQPAGPQKAGVALDPQPQIVALDPEGRSVVPIQSAVTLSVHADSTCSTPIATTLNGNSSLSGNAALDLVEGMVNFSGVSMNRAGSFYLKVAASGMKSSCSNLISVDPGAVSESDSILSADKTLLDSDGLDQAVFTVSLKDDFGNPISGIFVSAGSSSGNANLWPISATTNGEGQATFGVKSSVPEVVTLLGGPDADGYLPQSLEIFFSSFSPPQSMRVPFLLPTTGIETLKGFPMQTITPQDANSGRSYSFALVGALPEGLSFDSSTGSISGVPTLAGVSTVRICVATEGGGDGANGECQHLRISVVEETRIEGLAAIDPGSCPVIAGKGTTDDPIVINSILELNHCLRNYPARAYRLNADLDFSGVQINSFPEFTGVFDGADHELKNWSNPGSGPLFQSLSNGAVVKNLKLNHFEVTGGSGILTSTMAGAMVHHLAIVDSTITGGGEIGIVTGTVMWPTTTTGYHGSIDHVTLDKVTLISNTRYWWACSGLLVGHLFHTPFRISNIRVGGETHLSGGNALGVIVGRGEAVVEYRNQGNLWLDSIAVGSNVVVDGGAFASGMVGMGTEGDTISNSYSLAQVASYNIGGTGIVGSVKEDPTKGSPELIANTYFAGSLSGDGILVGSGYRPGKSIAVHTAVLSTLSQPLDYSGSMVSDSNANLTEDQFRDSNHEWFNLWKDRFSPPWRFEAGAYPDLIP